MAKKTKTELEPELEPELTAAAEPVAAPAPLATVTITGATWATGQATYTTSAPHGYTVGETITITGMSPGGYNGVFVTAAGTTGSTIVVPMTTNPGTFVSGGSASQGNKLAKMTTMGVVLDQNGDIWQYQGANGLVWLANTTIAHA